MGKGFFYMAYLNLPVVEDDSIAEQFFAKNKNSIICQNELIEVNTIYIDIIYG